MRTTGSLCSAFAPARDVPLTVKQAYAIALSARFPFAPSLPLNSSVTFWEDTAPVKLPTRHCSSSFLPRWLGHAHVQRSISLTTPRGPKAALQSLLPMLRSTRTCPIPSCSKASRVFSSNCR